MAHIRQSGPDSGLGFLVKVLSVFCKGFPSSLGNDTPAVAGEETEAAGAAGETCVVGLGFRV